MAKTKRLRRELLSLRPSGSLTQTQFHKHLQDSLLTVKHSNGLYWVCTHSSILSSSVLLLCVHTRYNPFAHPSCTPLLFILLFIKSQYTVFALLFYCTFYSLFPFFTYIYALVLCYFYIILIFILLHCPLSGPDLIYISLLIIPCIIYYVTK